MLGFDRGEDVSGRRIPPLLRRFLADPDDPGARPGIEAVLRHNLWDIVSLVALHGELARWLIDPGDEAEALDEALRAD